MQYLYKKYSFFLISCHFKCLRGNYLKYGSFLLVFLGGSLFRVSGKNPKSRKRRGIKNCMCLSNLWKILAF